MNILISTFYSTAIQWLQCTPFRIKQVFPFSKNPSCKRGEQRIADSQQYFADDIPLFIINGDPLSPWKSGRERFAGGGPSQVREEQRGKRCKFKFALGTWSADVAWNEGGAAVGRRGERGEYNSLDYLIAWPGAWLQRGALGPWPHGSSSHESQSILKPPWRITH